MSEQSAVMLFGKNWVKATEDEYKHNLVYQEGFKLGWKYGVIYSDARMLPGFPLDHSGSEEWFRGFNTGVHVKINGFEMSPFGLTKIVPPSEPPESPQSASEAPEVSEVQSGEEAPSTPPEAPQEG